MMHRIAIITALAAMLSGCATVTRGTTQAFSVVSVPAGAKVTLGNGLTCITPCSFELSRSVSFGVRIELDGYETFQSNVTSQHQGGGLLAETGNAVMGGLVGIALDGASGAGAELVPNPLVVNLVPSGRPAAPASAPVDYAPPALLPSERPTR